MRYHSRFISLALISALWLIVSQSISAEELDFEGRFELNWTRIKAEGDLDKLKEDEDIEPEAGSWEGEYELILSKDLSKEVRAEVEINSDDGEFQIDHLLLDMGKTDLTVGRLEAEFTPYTLHNEFQGIYLSKVGIKDRTGTKIIELNTLAAQLEEADGNSYYDRYLLGLRGRTKLAGFKVGTSFLRCFSDTDFESVERGAIIPLEELEKNSKSIYGLDAEWDYPLFLIAYLGSKLELAVLSNDEDISDEIPAEVDSAFYTISKVELGSFLLEFNTRNIGPRFDLRGWAVGEDEDDYPQPFARGEAGWGIGAKYRVRRSTIIEGSYNGYRDRTIPVNNWKDIISIGGEERKFGSGRLSAKLTRESERFSEDYGDLFGGHKLTYALDLTYEGRILGDARLELEYKYENSLGADEEVTHLNSLSIDIKKELLRALTLILNISLEDETRDHYRSEFKVGLEYFFEEEASWNISYKTIIYDDREGQGDYYTDELKTGVTIGL